MTKASNILFAAGLAIGLFTSAPALAGGSFSITVKPQNAEQHQILRGGLALAAIANHFGQNGGIKQTGSGNGAGIKQHGFGNQGLVIQDGHGHNGTLQQHGNNNAYGLFQFGKNTNGHVNQHGHNGTGATFQFGW